MENITPARKSTRNKNAKADESANQTIEEDEEEPEDMTEPIEKEKVG